MFVSASEVPPRDAPRCLQLVFVEKLMSWGAGRGEMRKINIDSLSIRCSHRHQLRLFLANTSTEGRPSVLLQWWDVGTGSGFEPSNCSHTVRLFTPTRSLQTPPRKRGRRVRTGKTRKERGNIPVVTMHFYSSSWLQTGLPGFDPRQRQKIFPLACVSRPALGPTQPPIQGVPGGPSPGSKARPGRDADHSPHLVLRSMMSRSYTLSRLAPAWRKRDSFSH
jgi:hypothetical protein